MTFEDLKKANATIVTTGIERDNKKTGKTETKEYAEVNQRIKAFRMCYPEGFILTEIDSLKDGVCLMTARVGFYDGPQTVILGEGHAYEKENSTFINKTSYIENCETSAVGRALGMAGFGIDTSIASAEEVQNAILNQGKAEPKKEEPKKVEEPKVGMNEVNALVALCSTVGSNVVALCKYYKVESIKDMTWAQWKQAMDLLTARKEKQNAAGADQQG